MRRRLGIAALVLLSAGACAVRHTYDPYVDYLLHKQRLQEELPAARTVASASSNTVSRRFTVHWEYHHGLYFAPVGSPNEFIWPDFVDNDELFRRFATAAGAPTGARPAEHWPLICECVGVEWTFHGQSRFIVRSADLKFGN